MAHDQQKREHMPYRKIDEKFNWTLIFSSWDFLFDFFFFYFPIAGWRSVDEEGRLPPGQNQFQQLPPGVRPAVSPEDKERLLLSGDVVTVPKGESIPKNTDPYYRIIDWKNDWLHWVNAKLPDKMRQVYNSLSLFPTEPNYHVRLPEIKDIWDCDVDVSRV